MTPTPNGPRVFVRLVECELRRSFRLALRYRFETALSLVLLGGLFFGLSSGVNALTANQLAIGTGTAGLLVGFLSWTLAIGGVSQIAQDVEEEAKTGTLEQVFLAYPGPTTVLAARNIAHLVTGLPAFLALCAALVVITGAPLHFNASVLLSLVCLDAAATGVGFLLGALTVLVKRARTAVVVVQVVVVSLLVSNPSSVVPKSLIAFMPMASAVAALRHVMVDGQSDSAVALLGMVANSALYVAIGLWGFTIAARRARRLGSLAQH